MSMVLTGHREEGQRRLTEVVDHADWVNNYRFLAAYYLAQLGDARGWTVIVRDLADEEAHTRLMATRHLLGFVPFDGTVVDGEVIDVRDRLLTALQDKDPYVANEVPVLLLEAGAPDIEEVLVKASKRPYHHDVRDAALHALQHLRGD
jgi:hypothetical protein